MNYYTLHFESNFVKYNWVIKMNKVLMFFKENNEKIVNQIIRVYGWQKEYDYQIISSATNYLFEDLEIVENIAPLTNENRDGRIKPKYYITVHDTGDVDKNHTAKFWSDTVKNEAWEMGKYQASFQYVVGNDGIYHQIPDNEVAYHAGDTTKYDYKLYDSGVNGSNPHPMVGISNGYYEIEKVQSKVLAPRAYKIRNGEVIIDKTPDASDINSQGVLCKLIDGKYYIGETYFNETYELIANRGGNNNSIGIESCINEGSDIYLTWQKTAKLVAYLLRKNNLSFDDVKQHHYFSGKNCPETLRMNNLWEHFMCLVKTEYQVLLYKEEGYKIELIVSNENVLKNGRIKTAVKEFEYIIKTTYQGMVEEIKIKKEVENK